MIKDKIVLITGASGGIGAAVALRFGRLGACLAIAARRKEKLDAIAELIPGTLVLETDLAEESQVREMVRKTIDHFGRLDILINNAATIIVEEAERVSSADLVQAFRANLVAPVVAAQEALPVMQKSGYGHIINIGSPGFLMGIPFYTPYVCSKAALTAWTRTIQAEWSDRGIYITEYLPGYIRTDSRPESRIGPVEQDFLMEEKQNAIARIFTKPKSAEDVARHIERLVIKPRPVAYSDWTVKAGAYLSNIASFRLAIAKQMVRTAKNKWASDRVTESPSHQVTKY